MQGAHLMGDTEHETCAIASGCRAALTAQDKESRGVNRVILNVSLQDFELVALGSERAGNGDRVLFLLG